MRRLQRLFWILTLLAVLALATWTRLEAVRHLPLDYDELTYIPLAYRYGEMMAPGRWGEIASLRENLEHPPLVKLLYAAELRVSGAPEPDWSSLAAGRYALGTARPAVLNARSVSAAGGVLQVLGVALANPCGGLLLALDTYHIN